MVEWIEIYGQCRPYILGRVSTLVVEWIEIAHRELLQLLKQVSTLVVEWIEISTVQVSILYMGSPPSWWSGLKWNGR